MKKLLAILLTAALFCACFAGCGDKPIATEAPETGEKSASGEPSAPETQQKALTGEITVFAAASMTETLTELGTRFEKAHPDVKVTFNFASSGKLMDQILAGADCDIFISAAPKQMNNLDVSQDGEKNPDKNDYVDGTTRINLLENKVALAVPDGNPKGVNSFDELTKGLQDGSLLLAMGGEGVPVGQYTQKIFAHYGLNETDLAGAGVLTYGEDVKAVTTQVSEKLVDCGIIYQTDACSAKLTVVDTATEEMCGRVIYPAAVLKNAGNPEAAKAFLAFLQTVEAGEVFQAVGFTPLAG